MITNPVFGAFLHMFSAENYIILNRTDEAEAHLNICVPLCREILAGELPLSRPQNHAGVARGLRGEIEAGVQQKAEAALETLKSFPSRRVHLAVPVIGIVGSTKAAEAGDADGALVALFVSALETASTTGERWYDPNCFASSRDAACPFEATRERGRAMPSKLPSGSRSSRRQSSGKLRAAVALAKLWADQGGVMKDVISSRRFMPGSPKAFDTADLRAAKTLLDGVS